MSRGPSPASQGVACCDVVNRGAAYYNGKIYYNTLDVQTVAVDANTGKEAWRTKLGTSTWANPSPWRRSSLKAKCWSATAVASLVSAVGWRDSTRILERLPGAPIVPDLMRTF